MKRAVFKLKDGEYINVPADAIDRQDEWIVAWQDKQVVAFAKSEIVDLCRLTESNEER